MRATLARRIDRRLDLVRSTHNLHASAATAISGLDRDRVAVFGRERVHLRWIGDQVGRAREHREHRLVSAASRAEILSPITSIALVVVR